MTIRYVGIGGNDANSGLTWALRKLTLNGVEDTPVVAGDTVYVGAGTYRELLTCDVSGTAGSPITYIGDYTGANTDGVGGVVRITGSDDDITATRDSVIMCSGKNFRSFTGFNLDLSKTYGLINFWSGSIGGEVNKCYFGFTDQYQLYISNVNATGTITISENFFSAGFHAFGGGVTVLHTSEQDDRSVLIQNNIFLSAYGVYIRKVGGVAVKNNVMLCGARCVEVNQALSVGQTTTVTNNILCAQTGQALDGISKGDITEDYNTIYGTSTSRNNVAVGANSNTYPPLFDSRWFFELTSKSQKLLSPFDLSSASPLINVAGTSPTTTDLRNQAVIGAQREWGALEYNPALSIGGNMIHIEEGIYDRLSTYSSLVTLISTRVYPLKLPQTATLPAITYQRISTPRELTHDQQAGGLALPRFQFNCWGTTFSSVKGVVKALRDCLNGYKGDFGTGSNKVAVGGVLSANEIDDYDPDSGLYWTSVDYFIHHQE